MCCPLDVCGVYCSLLLPVNIGNLLMLRGGRLTGRTDEWSASVELAFTDQIPVVCSEVLNTGEIMTV